MQLARAFGFAEEFVRLGFHDKLRFISVSRAVMNRKIALGKLEPFSYFDSVLKKDRETPLGVGVELLERVKALLKPAEEHCTNSVSLASRNGRSEVASRLTLVSSIVVWAQGMKTFGHIDFVLRGRLDNMGLHLGMNQID
jgi:hypothetical protein